MTEMNRQEIANRLKAIRNQKGWNQTEMGAMLGMNAYYGNIERCQDRYSDMVIINIAEKLDIDQNWLLTGEGVSPIPERMEPPVPEAVKPAMEEPKVMKASTVPPVPEPVAQEKPEINQPVDLNEFITVIKSTILIECEHCAGLKMTIAINPKSNEFRIDFKYSSLTIDLHDLSAYIEMLIWAKAQISVAV